MTGPPLVIGLTGGVASGKSLVSGEFRKLGVQVLDADQVSRQVVEPGQPALIEIAKQFGADVLNEGGRLNRARMREIVFSDAGQRRKLEQITHPRIRQAIDQWLSECSGDYAVIENAILIESGMNQRVDLVLVVDVPESLQRERLMQRDGIGSALIDKMLAAQLPRKDRLAAADEVIDNSGTAEALATRVGDLHQKFGNLAAQKRRESR